MAISPGRGEVPGTQQAPKHLLGKWVGREIHANIRVLHFINILSADGSRNSTEIQIAVDFLKV